MRRPSYPILYAHLSPERVATLAARNAANRKAEGEARALLALSALALFFAILHTVTVL